jgi:hypothetical protein
MLMYSVLLHSRFGWQFCATRRALQWSDDGNEVHCVGRSDALRLDCVGPEQVGGAQKYFFLAANAVDLRAQ